VLVHPLLLAIAKCIVVVSGSYVICQGKDCLIGRLFNTSDHFVLRKLVAKISLDYCVFVSQLLVCFFKFVNQIVMVQSFVLILIGESFQSMHGLLRASTLADHSFSFILHHGVSLVLLLNVVDHRRKDTADAG
jgi:hypothetical protein